MTSPFGGACMDLPSGIVPSEEAEIHDTPGSKDRGRRVDSSVDEHSPRTTTHPSTLDTYRPNSNPLPDHHVP